MEQTSVASWSVPTAAHDKACGLSVLVLVKDIMHSNLHLHKIRHYYNTGTKFAITDPN